MFYNTIDLDHADKQQLADIVRKISTKPCCLNLQWKDSSSKGYHISISCAKKCDMCRMVFDDQKRLEMDNNRDLKFQNTLFSSKEFVRGNLKTVSCLCDRCAKYGNQVNLTQKTLTPEEMIKKLEIGQIKLPKTLFSKKTILITFVLGYDYFECPVCKWFKFVNRKKAQVGK